MFVLMSERLGKRKKTGQTLGSNKKVKVEMNEDESSEEDEDDEEENNVNKFGFRLDISVFSELQVSYLRYCYLI